MLRWEAASPFRAWRHQGLFRRAPWTGPPRCGGVEGQASQVGREVGLLRRRGVCQGTLSWGFVTSFVSLGDGDREVTRRKALIAGIGRGQVRGTWCLG